jgi:TRAP-type transport system small permease protein
MAMVGRLDMSERKPSTVLARLTVALTWVLEVATMIFMGTIATLVFANAVGRYAFSRPLPWTEEVVANALVWLVASGIVLAGMRQSLICCDILIVRLRGRVQSTLTILCAIGGSAVLAYCAWLTWQYMGFFGRDVSAVLRIPKAVMIGAVFFALAGLALTVLAGIFKRSEG